MERLALATFVAPVEHPSVVSHGSPLAAREYDLPFAVRLVALLTFAAFLIQGYHPYAEDGGLYLAGVERLLHPALFPKYAEFVLEPTHYSLFAVFVATAVRVSHFDAPSVLLLLQLGSIFATLFALWLIASRCWPERVRRTGAVMLAACWLSLPVAGTALSLTDPYLTARSISTPCMLLALSAMLDATDLRTANRLRAVLLWALALAIAAAMHPLMAAYAGAATLLLACLRSQRRAVRVGGTCLLVGVLFVTAAWVYAAAPIDNSPYRQVALTRTYWFPSRWAWYELLGLAAPLGILAAFALTKGPRSKPGPFEQPGTSRSLCLMSVVAGASALTIAVCVARTGAASYAVARLQPLRIFQIVYFVMVLLLGAELGSALLRKRTGRWLTALLLLGSPLMIANRQAFSDTPHIELQNRASHNPWVAAFLWIRNNTPVDALFALDPDYINATGEDAQCFRAMAERSALPDYSKDGGEASIAPQLATEWLAGQQAQRGLNDRATTDAMRRSKLYPLGVSWLVLNADTPTALRCPYLNSAVRVCELR